MREAIDLIIGNVRKMLATLKGKKRRKLALQPERVEQQQPGRKEQ